MDLNGTFEGCQIWILDMQILYDIVVRLTAWTSQSPDVSAFPRCEDATSKLICFVQWEDLKRKVGATMLRSLGSDALLVRAFFFALWDMAVVRS